VKVPTIEGDTVTIRIPPVTPGGRVFRVKARGVATANGPRGDLLVSVEVDVPTELSDDERSAIEALRAASTTSPRASLGI